MTERLKTYFPVIMATVALFLLIIVVIVGLISNRGISTNRASTEKIAAEVERLNDEIAQAGAKIDKLEAQIEQAGAETDKLKTQIEEADTERDLLREDISANADRLQEEATYMATKAELQVLLLKASAKTLKARIHLAEKEVGLAERDLAECDTTLEAAIALADEKDKIALQEIRMSIAELKESVEARTFPIATLEIVSDKIDALIGK
ncbi:MAG: hypothetical protein H8E47_06335 [Anaerolineales bacterium]|nr:hypothetical protein [Anaerolineales bacterium]